MKNNLHYMYDNMHRKALKQEIEKNHKSERKLCVVKIDEGIILPAKELREGPDWGLGGVLDKEGDFVKESGIDNHFGGKYDTDEEIDFIDDTVIYISVIPRHWGHFLLDVIGRLWISVHEENDYKIAYSGWGFGKEGITGSFLEFFELLGISKERLININHPMKFSRVLIPENSCSSAISHKDCYNYTVEYKWVINKLVNNIDRLQIDLPQYDRIYFTRTALKKAKVLDIGEKEIKDFFETNGFKIISPEKISLKEQIHYIRNCKVLASISGTIAHNAIFASGNMELIILNRTGVINISQVRVNEMFDINSTYIDVYNIKTQNNDYALGPFWMELNDNVKRYAKDNKMYYKKTSYGCYKKNQLKYYCLKLMRTKVGIKLIKVIKKFVSL